MVPASILAKGERVALDYLLETSPLGQFFEREDLRRAVAEDIILEQFKPFVFTALFVDDEALLNIWRAQRPESHTLAKQLSTSALTAYEKLEREHYERRLRLRLSAYRKIDVWWCGESELFIPHESLGAEPYFTIILKGYEHRPVKIGSTRSSTYASDPKRDAVALELMQVEEFIHTIERALYPILPPDDLTAPQEWGDLQTILTVTENFRIFNRQHKLPVFPKALIVDPRAVPTGYQARFPAEAELWSALYALGISPILSDPAAEYLKTKSRSIAALSTDRDTLLNFLCGSIHFKTA
jgi:hypothetical protein